MPPFLPQTQRVKQSSKTATSPALKVSADAQLVTSSQSLSIVRTLVQTGIGVITYLRGIFPDECFVDDRIGPDRSENSNGASSTNSQVLNKEAREPRGYIKVKKIKPGASPESDVVLDYLDEGVMDAIQRGYLRQLLFAMYLDPENPRDVIECYTFNFTYRASISGEASLVPELEVRDQLKEMSLTGKVSIPTDSDLKATQKTGGMVKRQIQTLIKNLICSTQSLSDINGRRFLSFKLYYNERCPIDYQPPHFDAGDIEKDRFTFGTAGQEEIPSATEMGKVDTGFHTVRVALATISNFLQSDNLAKKRNPNEPEDREEYLKSVRKQAEQRPLVWDTEKLLDLPSPPSPVLNPEILTTNNDLTSERGKPQPLGLRGPNRKIFPLPQAHEPRSDHGTERPFKIWEKKTDPGRDIDQESAVTGTLVLDPTQVDHQNEASQSTRKGLGKVLNIESSSSLAEFVDGSLMNIDIPTNDLLGHGNLLGFGETIEDETLLQLDTQRPEMQLVTARDLENHIISDSGQLYSMPMTTRLNEKSKAHKKVVAPDANEDDPIQAFSQSAQALPGNGTSESQVVVDDPIEETESRGPFLTDKLRARGPSQVAKDTGARKRSKVEAVSSSPHATEVCECKDWHDDIAMIGCEVCGRWRHLACYGYKSLDDPRIPTEFVCYRCRIHDGLILEETWKREDEIKTALEGLRTLCIFRRALHIIYEEGMPSAIKILAKRLEIDFATASQLKKRLMAESYLIVKNSAKPSAGILESETRKKSHKKSHSKVHTTVNHSYEQKKIRDAVYFTPGSEMEAKLLAGFPPKPKKANRGKALDQYEGRALSDRIAIRTRSWTQQNNQEPIPISPNVPGNSKKRASHIPLGPEVNTMTGRLRSANRTPCSSSGRARRWSKNKNKVSIGVQEVEVAGVTWDDFSD